MDWIKRHLSPSLVISIIALSVALSGSALALTRNSVGADELKTVQLKSTTGTLPPGQSADLTRNCNGGQQVLGGGVAVDTQTSAVQVESSHPYYGNGDGWEATVSSSSGAAHDIKVEVLCLKK